MCKVRVVVAPREAIQHIPRIRGHAEITDRTVAVKLIIACLGGLEFFHVMGGVHTGQELARVVDEARIICSVGGNRGGAMAHLILIHQ